MKLYKHQEESLKRLNNRITFEGIRQLSELIGEISPRYEPLKHEIIDIDYEDLGE